MPLSDAHHGQLKLACTLAREGDAPHNTYLNREEGVRIAVAEGGRVSVHLTGDARRNCGAWQEASFPLARDAQLSLDSNGEDFFNFSFEPK